MENSMVWDGLIIVLIVTLAIAGWSVGIVNSWRGPLAVIIATLVTQQLYIDFATWIVQQLRCSPEMGIGIGYILMWGAIEIIAEILLNLILPFGKKTRPLMYERALGAVLGIFKALLVVILPLMCLQVQNQIPKPPEEKAQLTILIDSGADKSALIKAFSGVAKGWVPMIGGLVVSTKPPSFKPTFRNSKEESTQ